MNHFIEIIKMQLNETNSKRFRMETVLGILFTIVTKNNKDNIMDILDEEVFKGKKTCKREDFENWVFQFSDL